MKIEAFLDEYGRPAWLTAMVLGFFIFPLIGLAILAYMIWSGRMGCWGNSEKRGWSRSWRKQARAAAAPTGNAAFDAYREATLRRLEDEREAFADFMERLRKAKDQAEFDQFMNERGERGGPAPDPSPTSSGPGPSAPRGPSSDPFSGGAAPQPAG